MMVLLPNVLGMAEVILVATVVVVQNALAMMIALEEQGEDVFLMVPITWEKTVVASEVAKIEELVEKTGIRA